MEFVIHEHARFDHIAVQYIEIAIRTLIVVCITITYSTKYDKPLYVYFIGMIILNLSTTAFTPAKDEESDKKVYEVFFFPESFLLSIRLVFFFICLYISIHLLNKRTHRFGTIHVGCFDLSDIICTESPSLLSEQNNKMTR